MAGLTAKDLGYTDLAHVAVLRAEEAAALLDDPVQRGKVECLRIWALQVAVGPADGVEFGQFAGRACRHGEQVAFCLGESWRG
jgi:hypothetical protein